jgi:hypothetical protein
VSSDLSSFAARSYVNLENPLGAANVRRTTVRFCHIVGNLSKVQVIH